MRLHLRRFTVVLAAVAAALLVAAPTVHDARGATVGASAVGDSFGDAVDQGSMQGRALARPVVGMAPTRSGRGYWLVAADGGIFSFGDAAFYGSTGAIHLNQPIVGMAATPSGHGYWFVAADGGIFAYGDAAFYGSTGAMPVNQPIVGMAATPSGHGYWLVARDGGIFNFGDAAFAGSAQRQHVVGMASSPTGKGYLLLAADGGVFAFGDAHTASLSGPATAGGSVGLVASPDGTGYWAADRTGAVAAYGSATSFGSANAGEAVVGIARTPSGKGYWLVTSDGSVLTHVGAAPSSAYAFLAKDRSARPMRFNPCAPIRYVINPDGAPSGAVAEVRQAFGRLGAATGIQFVDAGLTTERHIRIGTTARSSYQPDRYGVGQWAPILISWDTADDEPILAGNVLGYGGSTSYWNGSSDQTYVTGEVVFDRDLSIVRAGFGPGLTRGNLEQHELGHVAGLDHVQDRGQVMYPSISDRSPDGYGAGDRVGLAQLGAQSGCLKEASPLGGTM